MYNDSGSGRVSFISPAIKTIMIVNAVFFLFSYILRSYSIGDFSIAAFMYKYFALYPLGDVNPFSSFYPWQLLTYQFMHADFSHLFFNLFSLWMFGSEVEYNLGMRKFIAFYLLSGIGAGIVQLIVSSLAGGVGVTVGASGAVYGVLVAFGVLHPDRRVLIIPIPVPIRAKIMIMLMIAFDLLLGLTSTGNVAHFAHLGGALTGYLLAKFGNRLKIYRDLNNTKKDRSYSQNIYSGNTANTSYWQKVQSPKEEPNYTYTPKEEKSYSVKKLNIDGEDITQAKIDEILDKINEKGYAGLSEREKKILFELSKNIK